MKPGSTILPSAFVRVLLVLLPLATCHPAHAQGPKTYDVTQSPYNADNTGATDAAAAINKAVTDAVTYGNANNVAVTVSLPAGTYFLQSSAIHVSSANNPFTLTGHSASDTFLTYTRTQNNQVLFVSNNPTPSLIVENITEDANAPGEFNFTQGTIIGFDRAAKTITVKAEAGYPLLNRPDILHYTDLAAKGHHNGQTGYLYTFSDPNRPVWDCIWNGDCPLMNSITPSADGTTAVVAVDHILPYTYVGEPWVMLGSTPSWPKNIATTFQYSNSVTFQNINYYGGLDCWDDGAGGGNTGAVKFINYYQGPPPAVSQPGRPTRFLPDRRATVIQGYQVSTGRGSITYTNCDLSGGWDDVLDLGNNTSYIIKQTLPNQIQVSYGNGDYRAGDHLELSVSSSGLVYTSPTLALTTDPVHQPDGTLLLNLSENVQVQNASNIGPNSSTGAIPVGDLVSDLTDAGAIVLQNSSFSSSLGHMFLKSGISIFVDHCLIHDMNNTGLAVIGAPTWGQGPNSAHNVTIQNSAFKNCQSAAIAIYEDNVTTGSNVLIQNNTFLDSASVPHDSATGVAVIVNNVNGVVIKNNWFDRNWGANICAEYDKNVTITGNTFNHPNFVRPPAAQRYTGLANISFSSGFNSFINPDPGSVVFLSNDDTVAFSGNIVNSAGPYTSSLVKVNTAVTNTTGLANGVLPIDNPLAFSLAQ